MPFIRGTRYTTISRGAAHSTPPTISSSATFSIVEGNTAVGTVTATGGQTPYTFTLSGGVDAALFSINSSTGALAFLVAPLYLSPGDVGTDNVYNVTVKAASVGGAFVTQAVAVTVTFDVIVSLSPLLWHDATRGIYSDAGTTPAVADDRVRQANDFSGGNFHSSQNTLANRPLLKTNIQNSLPGIFFDDSNDQMFSTLTRASVTGSSVWYAAVVTPIPNGSDRGYFGFAMDGTTYHQWYCAKNTSDKLISNGYDGVEHSAAFSAAVTQTGVVVINTFANATKNEIYRDGTLQQQVASGTPSIDAGRVFQLGFLFVPGNYYLHELLVMNGSPTAGKVAAVTAYLKARWGIA